MASGRRRGETALVAAAVAASRGPWALRSLPDALFRFLNAASPQRHPRAGDLLIGWVQHPNLTQGTRLDLEVDFISSQGGVWRSRALGFRGKFSCRMKDSKLILQDDLTVLEGRQQKWGIKGAVIHEEARGGKFSLQPLPDCYREWWAQVKQKLSSEDPGLSFVLNEGYEAPDEAVDLSSPELLRGAAAKLLLRKIQGGQRKSSSEKKSKRQEILGKFTLRPDEVKAYLDRYVICQDSAKEMLSVAICDHYNRAKEELLGPEELEAGSETDASAPSVCFTDSDEDAIRLQLEGDRVLEFVNGSLELPDMERFDVDVKERSYTDEQGSGHFKDDADVHELSKAVKHLFDVAQKRRSLKPARVKSYTKPNVLLLGPTGSGKTYLLKTLAELIGVPFAKADATKFTETGYVGRDADEVLSELLLAADGDVELAQVGIVYVDEIDKVCGGEGRSSSFRRATQSTFLKLMEDTEVTVGGQQRQMMMGAGEKGVKMSTRHVLFVFSGAFSQLDEQLKEEHKKELKGFGFTGESGKPEDVQSMLHRADTEELVKAGMEREFVGRLPVRVALAALSQEDLFQVLTKAEDGATAQLTDDFRRYGIKLHFTEAALRSVAEKAAKEGTGARALVTILENTLRRYKCSMPALVPKGCTTLEASGSLGSIS